MEKHRNEDKIKVPGAQYDDVEIGPTAIAPDGGIAPIAVGQPSGPPPATTKTFICLRGPCRHYWEMRSFVAAGNPTGTFGLKGLKDPDTGLPLREPKQINRSCLVHPGVETELTEDTIFTCNRWDPLSERELVQLGRRREKHYRRNPSHRPEEA